MIQSVTIKDSKGKLLIKISVNKKGEYEQICLSDMNVLKIVVKDEKGCKVLF